MLEQQIKEMIIEVLQLEDIGPDDIDIYGSPHVAKVRLDVLEKFKDRPNGKYIDISAITPTPLGEGKSTTLVGLGEAMKHIGKSAVISLRQPSQGPTFGVKGGAAGGDTGGGSSTPGGDNVVDAEFEEVRDKDGKA